MDEFVSAKVEIIPKQIVRRPVAVLQTRHGDVYHVRIDGDHPLIELASYGEPFHGST